MKHIILIFMIACCACSEVPKDANLKETEVVVKVEKEKTEPKEPTPDQAAADRRMADMTVPSLLTGSTSQQKRSVQQTHEKVKNHPLADLVKPENEHILRYLNIAKLDFSCRSDKPDLQETCDQLATAAAEKCSHAGIVAEPEDFKDQDLTNFALVSMESWRAEAGNRPYGETVKLNEICRQQLVKFKNGEGI